MSSKRSTKQPETRRAEGLKIINNLDKPKSLFIGHSGKDRNAREMTTATELGLSTSGVRYGSPRVVTEMCPKLNDCNLYVIIRIFLNFHPRLRHPC